MKKYFSLLFMMCLLVVGIIGCSSSDEVETLAKEETLSNEDYIKEFSKAINTRWAEQDKLVPLEFETEKEYNEKNAEILEKELVSIEKNLAKVEDKELKETVNQYIEGAKYQIEMFKTEDFELQLGHSEKSEQLRKPALIKLVDEYNVVIEEEFQQLYKDFKQQATVINKENDAQSFAEKFAQEIIFEKTTDEYNNLMYTSIVENTSDIEFNSLSYDVQYKDADGIVIGNDYINLENFTLGSKQKIELTYVPENTASLELMLNYLDLK